MHVYGTLILVYVNINLKCSVCFTMDNYETRVEIINVIKRVLSPLRQRENPIRNVIFRKMEFDNSIFVAFILVVVVTMSVL